MKHINPTCAACNTEDVNCLPIGGLTICKPCAHILHRHEELKLHNGYWLLPKERRGECTIYGIYEVTETKKPDYWETRKRINLLAQMDNKPYDNGIHGSY